MISSRNLLYQILIWLICFSQNTFSQEFNFPEPEKGVDFYFQFLEIRDLIINRQGKEVKTNDENIHNKVIEYGMRLLEKNIDDNSAYMLADDLSYISKLKGSNLDILRFIDYKLNLPNIPVFPKIKGYFDKSQIHKGNGEYTTALASLNNALKMDINFNTLGYDWEIEEILRPLVKQDMQSVVEYFIMCSYQVIDVASYIMNEKESYDESILNEIEMTVIQVIDNFIDKSEGHAFSSYLTRELARYGYSHPEVKAGEFMHKFIYDLIESGRTNNVHRHALRFINMNPCNPWSPGIVLTGAMIASEEPKWKELENWINFFLDNGCDKSNGFAALIHATMMELSSNGMHEKVEYYSTYIIDFEGVDDRTAILWSEEYKQSVDVMLEGINSYRNQLLKSEKNMERDRRYLRIFLVPVSVIFSIVMYCWYLKKKKNN